MLDITSKGELGRLTSFAEKKKTKLGAWLAKKKKQLDRKTKIAGSASFGGGGAFYNFLLKGKMAHS